MLEKVTLLKQYQNSTVTTYPTFTLLKYVSTASLKCFLGGGGNNPPSFAIFQPQPNVGFHYSFW